MQNDKKNYFILKILLIQLLVAAVVAGLFYTVKKINPEEYSAAEQRYADIIINNSVDDKLKEKFGNLKAYFVKEKDEDTIKNAGGKDEVVNGTDYPENCSASKYVISSDICRPAQGEISSSFGYRINPISEKLSFHTGTDIAAKQGEAVKAAYYGMVEKTGSDNVYGKYITVNHGNGIKTFYAHCSKITAKTGDIVNAGDKIAAVGSTGWSTGAHLHFSIIINGVYCDPEYVI